MEKDSLLLSTRSRQKEQRDRLRLRRFYFILTCFLLLASNAYLLYSNTELRYTLLPFTRPTVESPSLSPPHPLTNSFLSTSASPSPLSHFAQTKSIGLPVPTRSLLSVHSTEYPSVRSLLLAPLLLIPS